MFTRAAVLLHGTFNLAAVLMMGGGVNLYLLEAEIARRPSEVPPAPGVA